MPELRAVVYGVGHMNGIITRLMVEKGVTVVGAIARSPEKVGRDLGELVGLGRDLGVVVSDDADAVLAETRPDIAMIAVNSYLADQYQHLERCARHGVNALTLAEEALFPWQTAPGPAARLDELARAGGVTLTGSGHQDAYWVTLIANLMGTAHRIETVSGTISWNVDDCGPEVARDQRVGDTPEEFAAWLAGQDLPPSFARNAIDALIADAMLTVGSISTRREPVVADHDIYCTALGRVVETGRVIGFTDVDTIETAEGVTFSTEMTGKVYVSGEHDLNEWAIGGEPELRLSNGVVPTQMTTSAQLVNRIPDVINARPGFVTVDELPRLKYRAHPLATYLADA
jgi:hypothetical protein